MTAAARFKQADVTRAIKGAIKADQQIGMVRISPTGEILVYMKGEDAAPRANPLDDLLLKNGS